MDSAGQVSGSVKKNGSRRWFQLGLISLHVFIALLSGLCVTALIFLPTSHFKISIVAFGMLWIAYVIYLLRRGMRAARVAADLREHEHEGLQAIIDQVQAGTNAEARDHA